MRRSHGCCGTSPTIPCGCSWSTACCSAVRFSSGGDRRDQLTSPAVAKLFEEIDDKMRAFIEAQPMFFVGTAPSGPDGHVNLSPKGWQGPVPGHRPARVRLRGPDGQRDRDDRPSARQRPHRRDVLRVRRPAEDRAPARRRQRLQQGDDEFAERLAMFDVSDEQRRAVRSVIDVEVTRVADSCGFVRAADGVRGRARPALPLRRQPAPQGRAGGGPRVRQREQRGEHRRPRGPRLAGRGRGWASNGRATAGRKL